ncbi:MAG: MarR family transcriptional regulator [Pseudomonadota bacterium]
MADPFNLAEFLPYRLALIAERISRRLAVEYERSHGLSVAEWRVLANLSNLGTASVRDIQLVTNLEKSRVSRAVGRLETAKMVKKHVSAQDARLVEIALTAKGRATLNAIVPNVREVENRLLEGLTAHQMAAFYAIIDHLHDVLDADPDAKERVDKRAASAASKTGAS